MRFVRVVLSLCVLSASVLGGQATQPSKQPAKADDQPCGMIYGQDHFLSICAPTGWVLDNENPEMAKNGVYATFYRAGLSFQEAMGQHTVMYVNVALKGKGEQNASQMMKGDADRTKRDSPNLVIEGSKPILIPAHESEPAIRVPVQYFLNDYHGAYEAVAYVENNKTIVLIVITSVSNKLLHQDYPDFIKLVQSYRFLSSNVTVEKH